VRPLSQRLVGWAAAAILLLALAGVLIVVAASLIFLKLRGVTDAPMPAALWSWVPYYLRWGSDPRVRSDLLLSIGAPAGFVALLASIMVVAACKSRRRLRPARKGERPPAPVRAASDVHGNADWLKMAQVRKLFPGPHPAYGGVVVGEAYRVDQDKVAAVRFDPADRSTWGQGGKAPLLIDPCTADATHGLVFAGSGGFKTTAVTVPTLAYWTGSSVTFDPSCQVGPMVQPMLADMGLKVAMVGPGLGGFNVLDWIDVRDPLAETYVQAIIEWVAGETPANQSGENAIFKVRGKELLTCLLAHMLWDSQRPAAAKTLREFRQLVRTPEKQMPQLLADIHEESGSALARDLAGTLKDVFKETFSGIYSHANADTQWLSVQAYADMLSGGSFTSRELTGGKLSVFVQIPMDALRGTPQVARVVIGALMNTVYRAQGRIAGRIEGEAGRVLFLLDEVNFLGRMKVLEDARDAGRKYGITLVMMWQSLGQLLDTWGEKGKASWFNSSSWRLFAVVDDDATAKEISATCGRYTILARTEGRSRSMQSGLAAGSRNQGTNEGLSEQGRELIRPEEVRTKMRADEAIIFRRGAAPIRCGRPIYFRRPDLSGRINPDRFRTAAE
jgi:type IV secretion system protein VirD4